MSARAHKILGRLRDALGTYDKATKDLEAEENSAPPYPADSFYHARDDAGVAVADLVVGLIEAMDRDGVSLTPPQRQSYSPDGPDNEARAAWVEVALDAFGSQTGQSGYDYSDVDDLHEIGGDLICNLLHLAHKAGMDPERLIEAGRDHFEAERDEEEERERGGRRVGDRWEE